MKAMLIVIAVLASIATASADFAVCDEDFIKAQSPPNEVVLFPFEFTTPDVQLQVKVDDVQYQEGFFLLPDSSENVLLSATGEGEVKNQDKFSHMGIVREFFDKTMLPVVVLYFEPEPADSKQNGAWLEAPFAQIPDGVAPEDLENWAKTNHLSLLPPLSIEQLTSILEKKQISIDFKWLENLVSLGTFYGGVGRLSTDDTDFDMDDYENDEFMDENINENQNGDDGEGETDYENEDDNAIENAFEDEEGIPAEIYYLRPIAVPKNLLEKMEEVISALEVKLEEKNTVHTDVDP